MVVARWVGEAEIFGLEASNDEKFGGRERRILLVILLFNSLWFGRIPRSFNALW